MSRCTECGDCEVRQHRFDWSDLEYTGLVTAHSYWATWRIVEIVEWSIDDNLPIGWQPKDGTSAFPAATDPEQGETVVEITVKWDGCAHYSWNNDSAIHTCGRSDVKQLAEMLMRVHEVSASVVPRWNADVAV